MSGILRYMWTENPSYPNFLDKENPVFSTFCITVDQLFKVLRSSGVGATSSHTEGISNEEEETLWNSGVNTNTPLGLLRAVLYYNGKCFWLHGGQEHRELGISQLTRHQKPDRYVYNENSSKNRKGGLAEIRLEHKSVSTYANPEISIRCHVYLLDLYISKLPPQAFEKDIFYCRPCAPVDCQMPWYSSVPIGRNQLSKMVSGMCEEAGIVGKKTNHSLRVSGTSALFDAGVSERIIQSQTGHRSLEALRLYERVTDDQNMEVSKILSGEKRKYEVSTSSRSSVCVLPKTEDSTKSPSPKNSVPSAQYNNCTVNMYTLPAA